MSNTPIIKSAIFNLSPGEKLQLVEDLWDDLASVPGEIPIHEWQIQELKQRKMNHSKHPQSVLEWEELKRRVRENDGQ